MFPNSTISDHQLCQTLLGLAFASLVVAQSPNVDYGDCLNACSGVDKVESCDTNDSANSTASADADLNCLCNVYEQVIPGAVPLHTISNTDPILVPQLH